ncbi:hypothetical protein CEXT_452891 [Caerostris extrusa]|uniref:Ycf15 n=1 Tax=Caerostris extrusa TaxID=172846 RepID=A0AAV4V143_CAEEX|nr:hypothetical protein CEXT_452891 [Caerostris extrusa]
MGKEGSLSFQRLSLHRSNFIQSAPEQNTILNSAIQLWVIPDLNRVILGGGWPCGLRVKWIIMSENETFKFKPSSDLIDWRCYWRHRHLAQQPSLRKEGREGSMPLS